MPKVKIRAVNPNGYWIVDSEKHKQLIEEHKKKSGWVAPQDVQKMQQQGIQVPPHMHSEPLLPQRPGKLIPATDTDMELSDAELEQLRDDPNVLMLEHGGGERTAAHRGHKSE
jgi:hypothetical protein